MRVYTGQELEKLINRKRSALSGHSTKAYNESDRWLQREIQLKRYWLSELERKLVEAETKNKERSVFVSHTGNGVHLCEQARELCAEYGFIVKTGFDDEVKKGRSLPDEIIGRIRSSSLFLGIWTTDFDSSSHRGADGRGNDVPAESGGIPGVWLPFELGVAAAEGKPFKLLCEERMHRLYVEKPFASTPHIWFNRQSFQQQARIALSGLADYFRNVVEEVERKRAERDDIGEPSRERPAGSRRARRSTQLV